MVNHCRQHTGIRAAQQLRRRIRRHAAGKDKHASRHQTGNAKRENDMDKRAESRRAQTARRLAQVIRNVIHDANQRENHQRQEQLHKADRHRELIIQKALRLGKDAQRNERTVDDALLAENNHPAE